MVWKLATAQRTGVVSFFFEETQALDDVDASEFGEGLADLATGATPP
ncbi:MAG: hypothetical protein QM775_32635 [Pirellulales bacterium]